MRLLRTSVVSVIGTFVLLAGPSNVWAACEGPVALQVLGSGGPFGAGRASAGYIVWIDGVSRIMVDAGGAGDRPERL